MKISKIIWLLPAIAIMVGPALAPVRAETRTSLAPDSIIRPTANISSTQVKSFTRILSGDGWQTTIVLLDLGSTPLAFQQSFLGNNGTATPFTVQVGGGTSNLVTAALQGTVNANGSVSYTLPSTGSSLQEGWSLLTFTGAPNQLSGYAILRHRATSGGFNFEVTLPLNSLQDFSARLPFDNTNGFQTQLTVVNPASNMVAQVRLTYFDTHGQTILLDSLTLNPGEQMTLVVPNTYPDLAGQSGTIAVLTNINTLSVAGLRLNPLTGAVTSAPVIDFTGPVVTVQ
jgi:hypothetical protein